MIHAGITLTSYLLLKGHKALFHIVMLRINVAFMFCLNRFEIKYIKNDCCCN